CLERGTWGLDLAGGRLFSPALEDSDQGGTRSQTRLTYDEESLDGRHRHHAEGFLRSWGGRAPALGASYAYSQRPEASRWRWGAAASAALQQVQRVFQSD